VISTSRHLTQGGVSLLDENWDADAKVLSGRSRVVAGDPYVLTVHLPDGFSLKSAAAAGAKPEVVDRNNTATIRFVPSKTRVVAWKMSFTK
jgi:hypothetical protein